MVKKIFFNDYFLYIVEEGEHKEQPCFLTAFSHGN
jgi:hypothetical protein